MIVDQDFAPLKKVWTPSNIKNSGEVIQWIETAPNEDVIGWLSIGKGAKIFTITKSNRHLWKDVITEIRAHEAYLILKQAKLVNRKEK